MTIFMNAQYAVSALTDATFGKCCGTNSPIMSLSSWTTKERASCRSIMSKK